MTGKLNKFSLKGFVHKDKYLALTFNMQEHQNEEDSCEEEPDMDFCTLVFTGGEVDDADDDVLMFLSSSYCT